MFFENKKLIEIFFIITYFVLFVSVMLGSFYMTKTVDKDVISYIESYSDSIKNGMNMWGIAKSSIVSYSVMGIIVFLSSFFRLGPIVSLAMFIRKGFIDGFTLSGIMIYAGVKGFHLYIPYIPQVLIGIPLSVIFISISAVMSLKRRFTDKKLKLIYKIFFACVITIFCICSFLEGLLTTTFANWLSNKVT